MEWEFLCQHDQVMVAQLQSHQMDIPAQFERKTVRVFHIVESLDNQAVENWLLRVLKGAQNDYPQIHWTFFCVLGKEGRFDEAARQLGAEVIHSRFEIGYKRRFLLSLREVMKRGRYDILHCHHDIMSAAYLAASAGLPFRKRIVHVHNTSLSLPTPNRVKADLVRAPMRQLCLRMADQVVGISKDALESIIQDGATNPKRHLVVHYAVETARFGQPSANPQGFRRRLDLSPSAKILLFVGRIVEYKNPRFVIEMLEHVVKAHDQIVAVFAGTGSQEDELGELARSKSMEDRVRLLGFRDDVPALMQASDLLVWPSLEHPKEGLGLGIVEAQAAGLPVLMSRAVPEEAIVVPELVDVLPLSAGPRAWADRCRVILGRDCPARSESLRRVEASSFSMKNGVSNLMALYDIPQDE